MNKAIATPRLVLRPLTRADWGEFLQVHESSWDAWSRWMPAMEEGGFEGLFERMMERTERELSSGTGRPLAAFLGDGRIAGFFSIFNVVRGVFQNGSAGWRVAPNLWRQGYGHEGLEALVDMAFAEQQQGGMGLHRVQAHVIPSNEPSLRLAERVGFRREGYARRCLRIAGQWQDHIMLARLADEA